MDQDKGGRQATAGFEFDHYDLGTSLYGGKLAAYALGRLMRRLEWHFEQSIVLFAECSCQHSIRVAPSRIEELDKVLLVVLRKAVKKEAGRQFNLCCQVLNQLSGITQWLFSGLRKMRTLESLSKQMREPFSEHFRPDAIALAGKLRSIQGEREFAQGRRALLNQFVRRHSFDEYAPLHDFVVKELGPELAVFFWLGVSVEGALCPENVFEHMTLTSPDDMSSQALGGRQELYESVAYSAGFLLGFYTLSPGSLHITEKAETEIIQALRRASVGDESVSNITRLPRQPSNRSPMSPIPTPDDCEIEEQSLTADSSSDPIPAPPDFQCCLPPSAPIVNHFENLHAVVVRLIRESAPAPSQADPIEIISNPPAIESATKHGADTETDRSNQSLKRLLRVYSSGTSDSKFEAAISILASKMTVNDKLTKIDQVLRIPPTSSSNELGDMLGVTKTAVLKTNWWAQNRAGDRDRKIAERHTLHQERNPEPRNGRKSAKPLSDDLDDD